MNDRVSDLQEVKDELRYEKDIPRTEKDQEMANLRKKTTKQLGIFGGQIYNLRENTLSNDISLDIPTEQLVTEKRSPDLTITTQGVLQFRWCALESQKNIVIHYRSLLGVNPKCLYGRYIVQFPMHT